MKFKTKPVEIEAMQYTGENYNDVLAWVLSLGGFMSDYMTACTPTVLLLVTRQGEVMAKPGDWVVVGPERDELYPCSQDVFAIKYEPA